jgi:hypothetical protein
LNIRNLTLAALLLPLVAAAASVSIQLDNGDFKLSGYTISAEPAKGWASIFTVSVDGQDTPPMFGSYSAENGVLTFHPRLPLRAGMLYRALFMPPGGEAVFFSFQAPAAVITAAPTRVAAVYPTSAILPSNQLKLYVTFSAPMQRGNIWPKLHLIDDAGHPATLPFVELEQELWDRDLQRLTLLFDPGRIKRGVKPNLDMGPVLVEGRRYTLVIDRDLLDSHDRPLAETFRRDFTIAPPERRGIDLKLWKITEPRKNTLDPLTIVFDRPLDYALLQHVFTVQGVQGTATVPPGETSWRFQPAQPWKPGDYTLVIDMTLEDLAGNRIGRPFDVDTLDNPTERISKPTTTLPFHAR